MRRLFKKRGDGFTLVELLVVILIIGILSGILLLSLGASTDASEAARILNDIANVKGAALMFFIDEARWPAASDALSIDSYMDRAFITGAYARYNTLLVVSGDMGGGNIRTLIGVKMNANDLHREGVQKKLAGNAKSTGLWQAPGQSYVGGPDIYVSLN
ncbi:MAG: prepilin-type N-terminal cleavage/methylation domain-containing protein [Synergistaceae bacterium]|jgi:prepilin-type N-terminal cleavage/methylation domain-containing protein|nr:prepilin-type N-terminal cleavage/methylation domain-containing protein [Synergistaceae bacterium]